MGNQQKEREYEESRLRQTLSIAKEQLQQAKENAEKTKLEIAETKREAYENATHGVLDLNNPEDFENIAEFSQYSNAVNNSIAAYEEEERRVRLLENMMRSPYFARIDFRFDDEEAAEEIYIGRSSLKTEGGQEIVVYDWRSPIAGVFYRFMTGTAYYEAPCGRITGEVSLKRQYEINNGILEYFFDTDVQIVDEFLRQLLSQNTTSKMKAIVETIQKEQDMAIRDMENDLLMVQGVAGSGKTSIALHRAAYLMYQGLQTRLSADHIMIISPNSVFEQYISDVLPELGEEQIASAVFGELLSEILKEKRIQPRNEWMERLMAHSHDKEIRRRSIEWKTSDYFLEVLNRFLQDVPQRWIAFEDIRYNGQLVVSRNALKDKVTGRAETPLGEKLEQLEPFVIEEIFGTGKRRGDGEEKNRVRQEIQKWNRPDAVELYRHLFQDKDYFYSLLGKNEAKANIEEIWEYTRENLKSDILYYDDAIAAAYLYLKIYGINKYRNIRHVVIDEAQDYYPLQYELFRMLFPNAKFTVLGDMNQTIAKWEDLSLYERIKNRLNKKKSSLLVLDKSFRCTNEILNFSLRFIEHSPQIQSFNRNGDSPEVFVADNLETLVDRIAEEVKLCRERGFRSIGLICKHEENADRLWNAMKPVMDVPLIRDGGNSELSGAFIIPIYVAKGLEFDAVVICDADSRTYHDQDDKKLLYVACTRALHRLCLFGEQELSPLILHSC
ncbi:MAG: AAA family ATPase [Lachnospiraceae bacterium]|nr:AAA family ATPase [Lachnospiraceae bacterium]